MVILLCVTIDAAQSKGKSSAKKSAVVTYQYDAPYEHWKYGGMYFKINGVVKRFEWGDFTRFDKSILKDNSKAYEKGAEWRITYSVDRNGRYLLLTGIFTGRIRK
jgi:hypothetical protein